jgi:hypothetical protein
MASLVLDEDEKAIEADAGRVARRHGLSSSDQGAFRDQAEAILTYRELARMSLLEPLETMFPVLKSLLTAAGAWDPCVQAFLDARTVRSGHYRDIAPSFLGWLDATGWGQERWPFLLELAHAEILEVLVARFPDSEPPEGVHTDPTPRDCIVLNPATQVVSYTHAVHRVNEQSPIPEARDTHLLAFRNGAGEAKLMDLTPATAALLVQAQTLSLAESAEVLDMTDLAPAMDLLRDLCREGAIAGFQTFT